MSSHDNPERGEQAAAGQKEMEAYQGQGDQAMGQGSMPQTPSGADMGHDQGCSCGGAEQALGTGFAGAQPGCQDMGQTPQGGPQPGGMPHPGMMGGPQPGGMPHPGMMGGPQPGGMPHPGMMGGPQPQGMHHPGMMGGPQPGGMPYPGMMGGPQPGGHADGCGCHSNPTPGTPHAGFMGGAQMDQGNQFGHMFGMFNDIMNGKADMSTMAQFLDTSDPRFWKGALIGAALALIFTNSSVKNSFSGLMGNLFGSGEDKAA